MNKNLLLKFDKFFQCVILAIPLFFYTNCGSGFHASKEQASVIETPQGLTPEDTAYERGVKLYETNCKACHGSFDNSTKQGTQLNGLYLAISGVSAMNFLNSKPKQDLEDIAYALSYKPTVPTNPEEPVEPPNVANNWEALEAKSCSPMGLTRDIRILDPGQYRDSILDVFGYTVDISKLPASYSDYYIPESSSGGSGIHDILHLEALYAAAEKVANYTNDNFTSVTSRFSSCSQTTKTCQDQIATALLSRLLRKNLDSTDADYTAILNKFASITDFKARMKNIVMAGLMSPRFLYQVEYKTGFRTTPITQETLRYIDDHELASRLSFMLWNSVPDAELLNLAQQKKLSQLDTLKAQIARMMSDSKSQRFVRKFMGEWLNITSIEGISKDKAVLPAFSADLMRRFKIETESFALNAFSSKMDFRQFFTSDTTYTDSVLASHYGITGISGASFVASRRPQAELHAGILAHGSVSAISSTTTTDPIHRGNFEFQRFLCGQVGDPPASAALVVIEGTKHEQLLGRKQIQSCTGCHAKFEPIGYVSERLSPLGQFRIEDEAGAETGKSVQLESGKFVQTLKELGDDMASNPMVGYCLSQNLSKYALRGGYQSNESIKCQTENNVFEAFKNGNDLKSYIEAVVLSPFFSRKLETN